MTKESKKEMIMSAWLCRCKFFHMLSVIISTTIKILSVLNWIRIFIIILFCN